MHGCTGRVPGKVQRLGEGEVRGRSARPSTRSRRVRIGERSRGPRQWGPDRDFRVPCWPGVRRASTGRTCHRPSPHGWRPRDRLGGGPRVNPGKGERRRPVTACCSPAGGRATDGGRLPRPGELQRSEPSRPRCGSPARPAGLDALASASERTELLEVLQIRTGRGPMRRVLPHRGGADDPANRRADGAVAADQRRWPWIGATGRCPRWRRGRRDQTVGALNLFRAEPWGTGRTRPPRRQGAGRRRHHRRPAAPRRPGRRRGERTVPARARRGEHGVRVQPARRGPGCPLACSSPG